MRISRLLPPLLALALLVTNHAAAADVQHPQTPSLDRALSHAGGSEQPRVIIRYRAGAETSLRHRLEAHGDVLHARHAQIDALSFQIHRGDLAALVRDRDVLGVSSDAEVSAGPLSGDVVMAMRAWASRDAGQDLRRTLGLKARNTGRGVGIAIIDSGIAPVADLAARVIAFYDFTGGRG